MVYILKLKNPSTFLIQFIFCGYQGLNWVLSDPETDEIPLCTKVMRILRKYTWTA